MRHILTLTSWSRSIRPTFKTTHADYTYFIKTDPNHDFLKMWNEDLGGIPDERPQPNSSGSAVVV